MKFLLDFFKRNKEKFQGDNKGVTVIEVVLVLVILVALVLVFKNQIGGIIEAAFGSISRDSNSIIN